MARSTIPTLVARGCRRSRRQMAAAFSSGCIFLLIVFAAERTLAADLSMRCIYDVVTGTQEAMILCGEQLSHNDQATYIELVELLTKYINENARSEAQKITPDHKDRLRKHREMRVRQGFCKELDYVRFKKILSTIIRTPEEIRKRLATPGNPSEGDCF